MKDINQALSEFCVEYLSNKGWYSWNKINHNKLPNGIKLPELNQYYQNIELKKILHKKWKKYPAQRKELIKYYICTWGGIYGNKKSTMKMYQVESADMLIKRGIKGIASWSKALVLHDWEKYAIFDARVSCALNAIQLKDCHEGVLLFPLLPSRNNNIKKANLSLKKLSSTKKLNFHKPSNVYKEYLKILSNVAQSIDTNIATIEMLLFSKAEDLVSFLSDV